MSHLTDDEREALRVAYLGPWGDALARQCPPRIAAAVERILDARERAARAEALREAAEGYSVAYRKASGEAMVEVYDYLIARADREEARP